MAMHPLSWVDDTIEKVAELVAGRARIEKSEGELQ